ncbi:TMV resistance protein N-like [Dorcoceras hygrometricum]|uniref:TMV resistance protein N-like n=1 Tax=Dorcoceras hygrometricum TaxID=472368 RepID=A0A2Z7BH20_9LAMI|nr:TMV resistance protein N-like [Dorcoceras hygrometricum]
MELEQRSSAGSYSWISADEKRCARYGMSYDDISLDVITISRWLSADEAKRKRRSDVVLRFSRFSRKTLRCYFSSRSYSGSSRNAKNSRRNVFEHPVARRFRRSFWTTRRKQQQHPAQRIEEGAKSSSRCVISAAKQLTIYERWMSTAELNSNGESDKKHAKGKDTNTVPLSSVTQLRLFVHLRSLGVLTVAGCGIGSVHAVVRSNLLVEPSEVEEGEMPDLFQCRTGFSFDELSGCASLGQMPSFYFCCAVRSLGARLSDMHMGRDRRRKNLSCSLYWFFIDLSNSVARVI